MPTLVAPDDLAAFDPERFVEGRDEAARRSRAHLPARARLAITSANSSPPMRATCSAARRAALQAARDLDQKFVAGGMAELVVDLLEAIEVEQKHREFLAGAARARFRAASRRFVEGDAIGQMGQRVLPHRTLGLDLPHRAPSQTRTNSTNTLRSSTDAVDHHQEGDRAGTPESPFLPRQIAMPAKIGAVNAIGRDRDRGEGQRAARQHSRSKGR